MKHPGGRPRKQIKHTLQAMPQNGTYFTVNEACELLNITKHTLQARLRDETIKGKKISGIWRIYPEELQKD